MLRPLSLSLFLSLSIRSHIARPGEEEKNDTQEEGVSDNNYNNLRPPPRGIIEGSIELAYNWRELIGYPSATAGSGVVSVTSSSSNSRYHGDIRENPSLRPCKRPPQQQLSSRISWDLSYDGNLSLPPPQKKPPPHPLLPPRISHLTPSLRYRGKVVLRLCPCHRVADQLLFPSLG